MARNIVSHRPARLRQSRYSGEIPPFVITLGILLSISAATAVFFPNFGSTTLKTVFLTFAGAMLYSVSGKLQPRLILASLVGPRARYSLGDRRTDLVPEKQGRTQILQSRSESSRTASLRGREYKPLAALDKSPAHESAIAKPGASVSQRTERDMGFDENIVVVDTDLIEDDNEFDPRTFLAGVEGDYPLRRLRTRIGRNPDNDIVLDSDRISRYHVELHRRGGRMMVIDTNSRTGVWLNGRRVREPKPIRSGDLLRIGRIEFTFHLKEQKSR